jgi:hypothetical protein
MDGNKMVELLKFQVLQAQILSFSNKNNNRIISKPSNHSDDVAHSDSHNLLDTTEKQKKRFHFNLKSDLQFQAGLDQKRNSIFSFEIFNSSMNTSSTKGYDRV